MASYLNGLAMAQAGWLGPTKASCPAAAHPLPPKNQQQLLTNYPSCLPVANLQRVDRHVDSPGHQVGGQEQRQHVAVDG